MKRLARILSIAMWVPIIVLATEEFHFHGKQAIYVLPACMLYMFVIARWFTKSVNKIKEQEKADKMQQDLLSGQDNARDQKRDWDSSYGA